MPKFLFNQDFVPVSKNFIEKYMINANGAFVKVYLYALSLASNNIEIEFNHIAKTLNLLESDVLHAFNYWKDQGVILFSDDIISFNVSSPVNNSSIINDNKINIPSVSPLNKPTSIYDKPKIDIDKMTMDIDKNESLAQMFVVAQTILGKTITTEDTKTLYWLNCELGFSPESILSILEYCVGMNRRNISYAEKVAISLHEKGIIAFEDVEKYFYSIKQNREYMNVLKKIFNITDRAFTTKEESFLTTWHDNWGMSEEMIALAYEYCIMQINKLSFPYMNKIIEGWYSKNIHTIEQAEKENQQFKNKNFQQPVQNNPSNPQTSSKYDFDKLEKIALEKLDNN